MHRFRIALSFPGEHRGRVEKIAEALASRLGRDAVLYDQWYSAELNRPNLDTYLTALFHNESDLIAVFLCKEYKAKEWCGLEWRACRDLLKHRADSALMFFRLDDADVPGLYSIDGYQDIRGMTDSDVADAILSRLGCGPDADDRGVRTTEATGVPSAALEREYIRSFRECVQRLQSERSFINPWPKSATLASSETLAAPQTAAQMRRSGEVDPGLPSLRFSMQAKKLSVEELRARHKITFTLWGDGSMFGW